MNDYELTQIEQKLAATVRRAIEEKSEMYEEVWLTEAAAGAVRYVHT